jgi:hypothetical protein
VPATYPYERDDLFEAIPSGVGAVVDPLHRDDPQLRLEILRTSVQPSRDAIDLASRASELMMSVYSAANGAIHERLRRASSNRETVDDAVTDVARAIVLRLGELPPPHVDQSLSELDQAVTTHGDVDGAFVEVAPRSRAGTRCRPNR